MPFSDFSPVNTFSPIDTTVRGQCQRCNAPARGKLCAAHYYVEAVNGRGKQWRKLRHRPGKWVPPLIALALFAGMFALADVRLAFFLCVIVPVLMFGYVFGFKAPRVPQPGSQPWYDISKGYTGQDT